MNRIRILAVVSFAAFVFGVLGTSTASAAGRLVATVSDPVNISQTQGGKEVTRLKPGTYTINVQDNATNHNFHLKGPGVNKSTTVPFTGKQTWTVKLKAGKY